MSEEDLSKKIETYQRLGQENPNVDVNLLMVNALQAENQKHAANKSYKWPYLISLGLPPLGLIFALKYYFGSDEDEKQPALICVLLTIFSLVLLFAFGKILFSGSGASVQQIEQIKPQDIQQILQ